MKQLLILTMLSLLFLHVNAQDDADELKPTVGDMAVAFGVSNILQNTGSSSFFTTPGNTGTLVFKYIVAEGVVLRVGFSSFSSKYRSTADTTVVYNIVTTVSRNFSGTSVNLGAEYHFPASKRLDPYASIDIYYAMTKGDSLRKTDIISSLGALVKGDMLINEGVDLGKTATVGINFGFGVNFFINKHIAIGTEFNVGYASTTTDASSTINTVSGGGGTFG
ncbi:MAG: outer membrane beta-barrel protein, partial [Bacteroidetes bacterium]|nr:outer membrane beta-barrel protein [Bacteroidota bacterium]